MGQLTPQHETSHATQPKTTPPSPTSKPTWQSGVMDQAKGLGFQEGQALLSPTGGAQATGGAAPPATEGQTGTQGGQETTPVEETFDKWKLTQEQQALFLELSTCTDKSRIEEIMNTLVNDHKVPKEVVQGVLEEQKGFWTNAWEMATKGSWYQVSVDDKGNLETEFKLDDKGIGWETATMATGVDFKKLQGYYKDKDDDWSVTAGQMGKDYGASATIGTKEEGQHDMSLTGNSNSGGGHGEARYQYSKGEDSYGGGISGKVEEGKISGAADYSQTVDGVTHQFKVSGYGGEAGFGGATSHSRTEGKETVTESTSVAVTDTQQTYKGGYSKKDEEGSLSLDATAYAGDKTGGEVAFAQTEGKDKTSANASLVATDTQSTATAGYSQTRDGATHTVSGTALSGAQTGGKGSYSYKLDKERELGLSGEYVQAETDAASTTTAGGTVKVKEGDKVSVDAKVTYKLEESKEQPENSTSTIGVSTGTKVGGTTVDVGYTRTDQASEGVKATVHKIEAGVGQDFKLAEDENLHIRLDGTTSFGGAELGKEDTWEGKLTGTWTKGEKDDQQTLTLFTRGGHGTLGDVSKGLHLDSKYLGEGTSLLGGADAGLGTDYFQMGGSYKEKGLEVGGDLGFAQAGTMSLMGGHGYLKTDGLSIDLLGAAAQRDDQLSGLLRTTADIALTKSLDLNIGGGTLFQPGEEGHEMLWHAYAGLGFDIDKKQSLTVQFGAAHDGSQIAYIPELTYEYDKQFKVTAMASIIPGQDVSAGLMGTHKGSGISVFGGYGDPSRLSNPMSGSSITMPGMTGNDIMGSGSPGAGNWYVGVQWNALPTLKKLFGGK